ncbi:MAG: hypothetical protein ACKV2T_37525 [Kofleriaceae bacterium]
MRLLLACLVVAACSQPAPPPAKPPSQQVVRTPVSAVPTCADMGPLLRGPMDDEEHEGANKEALIVAACARDKWPLAVLECVASSAEPFAKDCLEKLSDEMLASYGKALEEYREVPDEIPVDDDVSCEQALAASALDTWPPLVTVEAERPLASKLRGHGLRRHCEDQHWDVAVRQCIEQAPISGIEECRVALGAARHADIDRVIEEADALRVKIVKAQRKPANITCEKAVAVHYGPAKWTGKAPELKGTQRTKAIAASKKVMLAACKSGWTADARACVVALDSDVCASVGVLGPAWGYPASMASSNIQPTGIAECDDYGAAVLALSACPAIPAMTTATMLEAFEQAAEGWKNLPAEGLEAVRTACKAAADATRQAAMACH